MAKGMKLPGNIGDIMKQAQQLQDELKKAQEEAKKMTVEASAGGGMVKVVVNGSLEIVSLEIAPEVVNVEDIEMLQDLIIAACNEALERMQEETAKAMRQVAGGLDIPGL
ncbi:MAG: YbaB/EbfC family nucleoid-associated protein [Candidatus Dadabacteria bacterium]|nr:MAG: YbaB/EbfC family nucleoid-associated protein [Candidatus Dadabacteria bacterium]